MAAQTMVRNNVLVRDNNAVKLLDELAGTRQNLDELAGTRCYLDELAGTRWYVDELAGTRRKHSDIEA